MCRTYTITDKQVSALHNGMCSMYRLRDMAQDMFKSDSQFNSLIEEAFKYIEPVKKELMDKKDTDFDRMYNLSQLIAKQHGFKFTHWSIYNIENFDETSYVPKGSKVYSYKGNYVATVNGDTWLDLWKAVEEVASNTDNGYGGKGFGDHVFIEGFQKNRTEEGSYEVWLGS